MMQWYSRTRNIDLIVPIGFEVVHPHDQYHWLRENAPVLWYNEAEGSGSWTVTRDRDV